MSLTAFLSSYIVGGLAASWLGLYGERGPADHRLRDHRSGSGGKLGEGSSRICQIDV